MEKKENRQRLLRLLDWLDDAAYLAGVGCLTAAGFLVCASAGLAVLGAGLVAFSLLISRGNKRC